MPKEQRKRPRQQWQPWQAPARSYSTPPPDPPLRQPQSASQQQHAPAAHHLSLRSSQTLTLTAAFSVLLTRSIDQSKALLSVPLIS
jgi:hypothetical protein